jgi:hypothetical protein
MTSPYRVPKTRFSRLLLTLLTFRIVSAETGLRQLAIEMVQFNADLFALL